jgi:4-azaleucine resistance transporter AzlC
VLEGTLERIGGDGRADITRGGLLAGVRAGFPFAIAGGLLSVSFGVVAQNAGLSDTAAILMSVIVFAGSAQFAAIAILAAGGAVGAAIVAAALVNSRFLAMGIALATSLPGRAWWRALQGQTVVDASWAIASNGDGTFDRNMLFGSTAIQYVFWVIGTVIGVLGGGIIGDTDRYGLDAIFPAFFLALLLKEIGDSRARGVALAGGLIALVLVPVAPAGVPILAASIAALAGLTRKAQQDTLRRLREEEARQA